MQKMLKCNMKDRKQNEKDNMQEMLNVGIIMGYWNKKIVMFVEVYL